MTDDIDIPDITPDSFAAATEGLITIATSTSRAELDEFLDPTTSTRSQPSPSRFTASWRLVVA